MFATHQEKGLPDGDPASRTPNTRDSVLAEETEVNMGATPDCPSAEGSEDMSVTNSEVESAMNHRRRRAVLRDPSFLKRHLMPSARLMHTSELLEMGLTEPHGSI